MQAKKSGGVARREARRTIPTAKCKQLGGEQGSTHALQRALVITPPVFFYRND
jgi:hypothetical protein